MSTIRDMPVSLFSGVSLAGAVLPTFLRLPEFTSYAVQIFFSLFFVQALAWCVYSIGIYPFFLSPFRHLPRPGGGIPLLGHSIAFGKYGPGALGRKW